MLKQMVRQENGFMGYGCSACGWLHPYPRLTSHGIEPRDDLKVAFLLHKCDEYPSKKMDVPSGFEGALAENFTVQDYVNVARSPR
jgi:hypothetical protein